MLCIRAVKLTAAVEHCSLARYYTAMQMSLFHLLTAFITYRQCTLNQEERERETGFEEKDILLFPFMVDVMFEC